MKSSSAHCDSTHVEVRYTSVIVEPFEWPYITDTRNIIWKKVQVRSVEAVCRRLVAIEDCNAEFLSAMQNVVDGAKLTAA